MVLQFLNSDNRARSDNSTNSGSVVITTEPVSNGSHLDNRHLVAEAGPPLDVDDVYLEKQ